MNNKLVKPHLITASACDNTNHMSVQSIFTLFMDLAAEHGAELGLGMYDLAEKGLIWLTTKTKIRIHKRPRMLDTVTATTWPEVPDKIRCNRYYKLTDGDRILAEGKTEWAMYELATGRLYRIADAYPNDLEHWPEIVCAEPFSRPKDDFASCGEIATHIVHSTDIDVSQHMNNVAYVRVMLSAFSCKELEQMNISEAEVFFRAQCYEGEKLSLRIKQRETGFEIGILKEDGKTAAIGIFTCGRN
ncbi:MAG: hypothetical protein IJZ85_01340 [Lachnospiraceae bacterium]|nr:hypothetical protein [Lachnospiraceae bacterium]